MQATPSSFAHLADRDLLEAVKQLAAHERHATAALIASLVELDARRLYLGEGCASLFVYCTRVLRLSEHAAYHRIEAARAVRRFPVILDRLADGGLTLTTVTLLAPHLTAENHEAVLEGARHRSKREVEHQIAALAPRADAPVVIRRQPTPPTAAPASVAPPETIPLREPSGAGAAAPLLAASAAADRGTCRSPCVTSQGTRLPVRPERPRAVVEPLSPDRYKVQITVSASTIETLRRVQDLMRHAVPSGDPATIVDRALTLLLADLERRKLAAARRPRPPRPMSKRSRHIPAAVRRAVWARDEGRCTFVGPEGRCVETGLLELHHLEPYALGGATTIDGVTLRCRPHNLYEAEREFGMVRPASGGPGVQSRSSASAAEAGVAAEAASGAAPAAVDSDSELESPGLDGHGSTGSCLVRERRSSYGSLVAGAHRNVSAVAALHPPTRPGPG